MKCLNFKIAEDIANRKFELSWEEYHRLYSIVFQHLNLDLKRRLKDEMSKP
jgi:hypothetical protein